MPIYHRLGEIPPKRHTVFRKPDGSLYPEELIGNKGFTGPSSLLYHVQHPTPGARVKMFGEPSGKPIRSGGSGTGVPRTAINRAERDPRPQPAALQQRRRVLSRSPTAKMTSSIATARATRCLRQRGPGRPRDADGRAAVPRGDYLVIPRGILHRYSSARAPRPSSSSRAPATSALPSATGTSTASSWSGALSERDIRRPANLRTIDEKGEFRLSSRSGTTR